MSSTECVRLKPGGLSRAVADMRNRWSSVEVKQPGMSQPKNHCTPKPWSPSPSIRAETPCIPIRMTRMSGFEERNLDLNTGLEELQRLMETNCIIDSPVTSTFLGVSPPVRSGACNPLIHDVKWGSSATLDDDAIDCCLNTPEWPDKELANVLAASPNRLWPLPYPGSPHPTLL